MIIPEVASNCFQTPSQGIQPQPPYTDVVETSSGGGGGCGGGGSGGGGSDTQLGSLLCSLSMLKEKVNQVQSLAALFISSGNHQGQPALASMGTLIQEIIVTASSMMFNCQQMALGSPQSNNDDNNNNNKDQHQHQHHQQQQQMFVGDGLSQLSMIGSGGSSNNNSAFLYGESFYNCYTDNIVCNNNNNNNNNDISAKADSCGTTTATTTTTILDGMCSQIRPRKNTTPTTTNNNNNVPADQPHPELGYDIVELDAANLLAKYTHYCQVCGKGFKRDANLRMHMRAHGDEYKSSAALSNPLKHVNGDDKGESSSNKPPRKYSCPQEGCRWNKKHAKFQPLKSMICVKNHYKRSHCPKMYVCKRCNRKQFSVLSDLRTHEKHCGDLKWQCSCGTTFSRKDKLMGHVALFVGHTPIINPSFGNSNKIDCQQPGLQIQFEAHNR